ncbi:MAG: FAD:protein FMN transferase, partial [Rhodospirillaceae bacterium]|nr:FAD:protein FMN transferase [Rhodospirillaceae bacterium]
NGAEGYNFAGHQYGHVINPKTAKPVSSSVMQVSVLAPNAMLADGLATASLVMGPQKAAEMLKQFDAGAMFLMRNNNNTTLHEIEVLDFSKGLGA